MLNDVVDTVGLSYLKIQRWLAFRHADLDQPLRLLQQYSDRYAGDQERTAQLVAEVMDRPANGLEPLLIAAPAYADFKQELDKQLAAFEGKPYQLGAMDAEIDVVVAVLAQFAAPKVLEIGVANGYSSAFLYYALDEVGGQIVSIDMSRFYGHVGRPGNVIHLPEQLIRSRLAKRGKLPESTGTLGDLKPGGVVPPDKYAGWLVPMRMRLSVQNASLYGNAFDVLEELPGERFDFVVFDAMKPYDKRMHMLEMIEARLRPNGVCAFDGYWANAAFEDFCAARGFPTWKVGRVGFFAKRPA